MPGGRPLAPLTISPHEREELPVARQLEVGVQLAVDGRPVFVGGENYEEVPAAELQRRELPLGQIQRVVG